MTVKHQSEETGAPLPSCFHLERCTLVHSSKCVRASAHPECPGRNRTPSHSPPLIFTCHGW